MNKQQKAQTANFTTPQIHQTTNDDQNTPSNKEGTTKIKHQTTHHIPK